MLDSPGFDKDELANLLDQLPDDGWVVDEVLSSSQYETTQIVHRDRGVVDGKYVRKVFARDAGLGAAYRQLLAAQTAGERFEHLPLVYDMVDQDDGLVVVTEFVQGQTLRRFVESRGHGVNAALFAGQQLCDAMRELHEGFEQPIVHRDLKPSNLVVASGKLMLIDLGIARTWRAGGDRDTVRLGTPGYAPPEQFGYGQTTPQSDIYAAGMVVAFCLTGEDPTPQLRESGFDDPRIPEAFRPVLVRATALDAAQRYSSARDMKSAFDQVKRSIAGVSQQSAPAFTAPPRTVPPEPVAQASASSREASEASPRRHRLPDAPEAIGKAWNVLLAAFWVFLACVSVYTSIVGGTEFLNRLPVWHRLFEYLALIIVPSGLLAILLSDKRRMKGRFPILARYTWPQLALRFLGLIAALYTIAVVVHFALFGLST